MMPLTCSIACAASATADWMAPTWLAISSVALAVWPASDLTSEATTAKPRPASPARAASMVALSAKQVGLPGDRLDQADHLADAGGGVAELRHGADGAARFADGARGDFGGAVRLAGDLADGGGKLLDRGGGGGDIAGGDADPLLGGAGLGGDGVGGAVELGGGDLQPLGGLAHARRAPGRPTSRSG